MTDQPPDQPQVPGVQPSPVPTAFTVGSVRDENGTAMVVFQAQTPVGIAVYFLEPGAAVQVGNHLRAQGKEAGKAGLVVPANGLVVPGR